MSLRTRLIASILFVLLISLCIGGVAAYWHAVQSVRTEMQAMLTVGVQTVRNGIDRLPEARDSEDEIERLVRTFDGDRHVRVVLRDATGQMRVGSTLPTLVPAVPAWFVGLFGPVLAPVRLNAPSSGTITIEPDPHNEIGEVWGQLQDDIIVIEFSSGFSIVLMCLVVGRALRPLDRLSSGTCRCGFG